jgi:hypothetical protein
VGTNEEAEDLTGQRAPMASSRYRDTTVQLQNGADHFRNVISPSLNMAAG